MTGLLQTVCRQSSGHAQFILLPGEGLGRRTDHGPLGAVVLGAIRSGKCGSYADDGQFVE